MPVKSNPKEEEWVPAPGVEEEEWQEVEGALITWNEPKELIGEYRGSVEQDGKFGKQEKHTVVGNDGRAVSFFAPTVLSRLLESILPGTQIRIAYPGTTSKSKTGQDVKDFRVFMRRAP